MRRVRLAAHFPGVNNQTVWSDPSSGSHIDLESFTHLTQTAERGLFDLFFLAEGLSLRRHAGQVHDLDVAGRPDSFTVLSALAAQTDHIGLMATLTTTYHEPHELARQLATLDQLSNGRAGWNLVTSTDQPTGENFTWGAHVPYADRYTRAEHVLEVTAAAWRERPIPQGRPMILQAGDSSDGREFAAKHADGVFTRHGTLEQGQRFYADVKGRLGTYGRAEDSMLVLPGATFVLGDTDKEAEELALEVRRTQISGPTARVVLEQLWNRSLADYDPDGPLPDVEPHDGEPLIAPGSIPNRMYAGRRAAVAQEWRKRAAANGWSVRELVIAQNDRQAFVGSPQTVAAQIHEAVQERACDGFVLIPHVTPGGMDRFVDEVVPELQARGSYRDAYPGGTLRDVVGLPPL